MKCSHGGTGVSLQRQESSPFEETNVPENQNTSRREEEQQNMWDCSISAQLLNSCCTVYDVTHAHADTRMLYCKSPGIGEYAETLDV